MPTDFHEPQAQNVFLSIVVLTVHRCVRDVQEPNYSLMGLAQLLRIQDLDA
jgi:hypothetical protein